MTVSDFRTKFPELPDTVLTDAAVQSALDDAELMMPEGDSARHVAMVLYCAAHLVTAGAEGAVPLISTTHGPVRAQFEESGERPTARYWTSSIYGRKLLQIIRSNRSVAIGDPDE